MDAQLQEIIDKIHQEGVKNAEEEARKVLMEAERKASEIVTVAQKDAESLIEKAKSEAERSKSSGEAALSQAGRDLLLSVKKELAQLFKAVVAEEAGAAMTPEKTGEIVAALVQKWSDAGDVEVLVDEKDAKAMEASMNARLAGKLKSGVTIRPVKAFGAGFRIGTGDGQVHYDFSSASVAEVLGKYVNKKLSDILNSAAES